MDHFTRRTWKSNSGASAVEFAIVSPVFLLLLLGILAYGIYFGAVHSITQLAADAARAAVAGISDAERISIAQQHVARNASSYVVINPKKVLVKATPLAADASQFRVSIQYDASELPIWNLAPFLPLPTKTIERAATIQRGGY